jgi:hypothetical protein
MRCRFLLLSSLCISLIPLPISSQSQTTYAGSNSQPVKIALSQQLNPQIAKAYQRISAGIEGRNLKQVYTYVSPEYIWIDTNGNKRSLQQAIQTTSEYLRTTSNIKYFRKIESISYGEQLITVSGTVYMKGFERPANNSYSREVKFQDKWIRTGNGLKWISQHDLSESIAWATPRRQVNPTGQAQSSHDLYQASNLADIAIEKCYVTEELNGCDSLNRIKTTISGWCFQGDQGACALQDSVVSRENNASVSQSSRRMRW